MIDNHFNFSKIYFIVSDKEDKVAKGIFHDIVKIRCEIKNISSEYVDVNSQKDFKSILSRIEKKRNRKSRNSFSSFRMSWQSQWDYLKI